MIALPAEDVTLGTKIFQMTMPRKQDKEFFDKCLSSLVGEVFGEELMDKTKPDFYMVNFLRDDILDDEGALVEEAPKVRRQQQGSISILQMLRDNYPTSSMEERIRHVSLKLFLMKRACFEYLGELVFDGAMKGRRNVCRTLSTLDVKRDRQLSCYAHHLIATLVLFRSMSREGF